MQENCLVAVTVTGGRNSKFITFLQLLKKIESKIRELPFFCPLTFPVLLHSANSHEHWMKANLIPSFPDSSLLALQP